MHICIFEDQYFSNFYPLVYFRPVYDLRCGGLSLRKKIEALFPRIKTTLLVRHELSELLAEEAPGAYKDVDEVVMSVKAAGLSDIVARLVPMGVVKG